MKKVYYCIKMFLILLILILPYGCGKKEKTDIKFNTSPVSIKKYDTPAGADPSVSAEMGGNGFTGEGWETKSDYNIPGSPNAVKGGSIVISLPEFPPTLRIIGKDYNNEFSRYNVNLLYQTLLGQDHITSEYIPMLATHWKILDDKMTFRFRINPKARWADGKPVTSEDFLATFKLYNDPGILDPYTNQMMQSFEEPVAESKYIFSIKSKELNWIKFYNVATEIKILPAHYIKDISGKEFLEKYQFSYIPGSGPYLIEEKDIVKGQSLSLKRRSDYWGENEKFSRGINNFDIIKFIFIEDESLEYEKFKKGDIDVLGIRRASAWQEKFEFDEVKRGLIQKRKIFNEHPNGIQGICINTRKAPFDDIRIRKALAYAFDRNKYNEKLFFNSYIPMNSYFAGTVYENPENPKIGFNLDSSNKLLSEAGWAEKNQDGYLVKNGKIFEIDMPFQKGMDRYLTIYQEDLKKVGIKLNLKEIDLGTTVKLGDERNFTLLPITWTALVIPNPESTFSSKLADEKNNTNWTGIKDKKVDELCEKYNFTFEKSERVKIVRQIDRILCDFAGYVLMWYAPYQRIVFQNKFGYPDGILDREAGVESVLYLWYCDIKKISEYDEAVKDKTKMLVTGETDNKYWLNLKKK
jgi:microcin C transport system substrate-binding protein